MVWVLTAWPAMVWACAYPTPVRTANAILLEVLNNGGQINNHHRARLARTMEHIAVGAGNEGLTADLSWRDARAVRAVVEAATTLARGIGREVDPDLRGAVTRVRDGIQTTCVSADAATAARGEDATGSERGTERNTGSGGRALTFGEGVVRLSLTFTIYLAFLIFLFVLRRHLKTREVGLTGIEPAAPEGSASAEIRPSAKATQTPVGPLGAMPPRQ